MYHLFVWPVVKFSLSETYPSERMHVCIGVCVYVCMCERERDRVSVCVWERERDRVSERVCVRERVCVCVCVRVLDEREQGVY